MKGSLLWMLYLLWMKRGVPRGEAKMRKSCFDPQQVQQVQQGGDKGDTGKSRVVGGQQRLIVDKRGVTVRPTPIYLPVLLLSFSDRYPAGQRANSGA